MYRCTDRVPTYDPGGVGTVFIYIFYIFKYISTSVPTKYYINYPRWKW